MLHKTKILDVLSYVQLIMENSVLWDDESQKSVITIVGKFLNNRYIRLLVFRLLLFFLTIVDEIYNLNYHIHVLLLILWS